MVDEKTESYDSEAKIEDLRDKLEKSTWGINGVLAVATIAVALAVISPILDALRFKGSSYTELVKQIEENNDKIDDLQEEIKDLNNALGVRKIIEILPPERMDIKKNFSVERIGEE